MKRIFFSALAAIAILTNMNWAEAQYPPTYSNSAAPPAVAPVTYSPIVMGSYRNHASTSEQGVLSGLADLYRGVGEYEVVNSIAAYNWQLARNAALQNSIAERAARAQVYRHSALMQEFKHKENIKKNQAVAQHHAKRLNMALAASQLDRTTGKVTWPPLLYEARFEPARLAAEETLREKYDRHQVSVVKSDQSLADALEEMHSRLEKDKKEIRPSDFYAARAFLERMKSEVGHNEQRLAGSF